MGFASGFRTGLATGESQRRSNMPLIQGLGSMISSLAQRNKPKAVRYSFSKGPSSYDKYVARKQQEEAAAEEKRRYEEQTRIQREQMETQQQQAEAQEARAQEMHEQKIQSIEEDRARAAELFERSKKKEARIEAYRGLLQGAAARNKGMVESAWAALAPDLPEKEAKEFAQFKEETVTDPNTGETYRKFTVGRDPKTGQESEKAMPAPAVTFNDDGSILVEYPGGESQTFANDDEFKDQLAIYHPEAESDKSLEDKEKKKEKKKERKRKEEKHQMAKRKGTRDEIMAQQKRLDTDMEQGRVDEEEVKRRQAEIDKMWAEYEGKDTNVVEVDTPEGKMMAWAGKEKPRGPKGAEVKRDENNAWHYVDPETKDKVYFKPKK